MKAHLSGDRIITIEKSCATNHIWFSVSAGQYGGSMTTGMTVTLQDMMLLHNATSPESLAGEFTEE